MEYKKYKKEKEIDDILLGELVVKQDEIPNFEKKLSFRDAEEFLNYLNQFFKCILITNKNEEEENKKEEVRGFLNIFPDFFKYKSTRYNNQQNLEIFISFLKSIDKDNFKNFLNEKDILKLKFGSYKDSIFSIFENIFKYSNTFFCYITNKEELNSKDFENVKTILKYLQYFLSISPKFKNDFIKNHKNSFLSSIEELLVKYLDNSDKCNIIFEYLFFLLESLQEKEKLDTIINLLRNINEKNSKYIFLFTKNLLEKNKNNKLFSADDLKLFINNLIFLYFKKLNIEKNFGEKENLKKLEESLKNSNYNLQNNFIIDIYVNFLKKLSQNNKKIDDKLFEISLILFYRYYFLKKDNELSSVIFILLDDLKNQTFSIKSNFINLIKDAFIFLNLDLKKEILCKIIKLEILEDLLETQNKTTIKNMYDIIIFLLVELNKNFTEPYIKINDVILKLLLEKNSKNEERELFLEIIKNLEANIILNENKMLFIEYNNIKNFLIEIEQKFNINYFTEEEIKNRLEESKKYFRETTIIFDEESKTRKISIRINNKEYTIYEGRINNESEFIETGYFKFPNLTIDGKIRGIIESDEEIIFLGDIQINQQCKGKIFSLLDSKIIVNKKEFLKKGIKIIPNKEKLVRIIENQKIYEKEIFEFNIYLYFYLNYFYSDISHEDNLSKDFPEFGPIPKKIISYYNPFTEEIKNKALEFFIDTDKKTIFFNFFKTSGELYASFEYTYEIMHLGKMIKILVGRFTEYDKGKKTKEEYFLGTLDRTKKTIELKSNETKKTLTIFKDFLETLDVIFEINLENNKKLIIPRVSYSFSKINDFFYSSGIRYYTSDVYKLNRPIIAEEYGSSLSSSSYSLKITLFEDPFKKQIRINIKLLLELIKTGKIKKFPDDLYKNINKDCVINYGKLPEIQSFLKYDIKKIFMEYGISRISYCGLFFRTFLIIFSRIKTLEELYRIGFLNIKNEISPEDLLKKIEENIPTDPYTNEKMEGFFSFYTYSNGHAIVILVKNKDNKIEYRFFDSSYVFFRNQKNPFNFKDFKEFIINNKVQKLGTCWLYASVMCSYFSKLKDEELEEIFSIKSIQSEAERQEKINNFDIIIHQQLKDFFKDYDIEFIYDTFERKIPQLDPVDLFFSEEKKEIMDRKFNKELIDHMLLSLKDERSFEEKEEEEEKIEKEKSKEIDYYEDRLYDEDIEDEKYNERLLDYILSSFLPDFFKKNPKRYATKEEMLEFFFKELFAIEDLKELGEEGIESKLLARYKEICSSKKVEEIKDDFKEADTSKGEIMQLTADQVSEYLIKKGKWLDSNLLNILNYPIIYSSSNMQSNFIETNNIDNEDRNITTYNFIFPALDTVMLEKLEDNILSFLDRYFGENQLNDFFKNESRLRIFIPININRSHWVLSETLVEYNQSNNQFDFYNSIHDSFSSSYDFLNKKIFKTFEEFFRNKGKEINNNGEILDRNGAPVKPTTILQRDSYSCSYFVSLFLKLRMENVELSKTSEYNIEGFIREKISELEKIGELEKFKKELTRLELEDRRISQGIPF